MAGKAAVRDTAVRLAKAAGRWRVAGVRRILPAAALACVLALLSPAQAQPARGEASLTTPAGYARLLLQFGEEVPTEVTLAGTILVVRFTRPVDIPVDRLSGGAPTYVGSVRRDPDGMAIRLALAQKVRVNTMTAGERIFIGLLPEKWTGLPPPLPAEVARELAERAMAAERALRLQKMAEEITKKPPVRVRTSVQPTFVRFVFELPNGVGVSSSLSADKFMLSFTSALTFDLADAKVSAPANVKSITQKITDDTSAVDIALIGEVDVHAFREDRNYIVDIGFEDKKATSLPEILKPAAAKDQPAKTEAKAEATSPKVETPSAKPDGPADKPTDKPAEAATPAPAIAPPATTAAKVEAPRPAAETAPAATEDKAAPATQPKSEAKPSAPHAQATPAPTIPPSAPIVSAAHDPPAAASLPSTAPPGAVVATARRTTDDFKITFPFGAPTPAALFRRSDAVWLVIAGDKAIDVSAIEREGGPLIANARVVDLPQGHAIRIKLNRPQLASLGGNDEAMVLSLANAEEFPPRPLTVTRNIADPAQANVSVALEQPGPMLRLADPDAGDTLTIVTARLPAQGLIRRQSFVEFALLASIHGVVIQPNADDLSIRVLPDKVVLGRTGGLTLSAINGSPERVAAMTGPVFDIKEWKKNQDENFNQRLDELMRTASLATGDAVLPAHMAAARFYVARGFYPEANGILHLGMKDQKAEDIAGPALILRAVVNTLAGRPERAMKDLENPAVGNNFDSQLWKAFVNARLGKWVEARERFKNAEFAMMALPLDLQRLLLIEAMRSALEVKDYSTATARANDLATIGIPPELEARIALLNGRLAEALGREKDALAAYRAAMTSTDRAAAAEATLAEIALRQKNDEIGQDEALSELEILSVTWRGDRIEARTLQMLSRLYAEKGRYNEAFAAAIKATNLQPNGPATRAALEEASALFSQLYLTSRGDDLPPVEALAVFYEYRDLTPIGRRGDEMIRRLADRLVAVDLLDQAGELLQYQVDHRLEGAARAQVAARLATIYLMNRKPERAIAALRSTRIADLAGEVRQQRLLLEARAQSDIGRHDLALDIISNIAGREASRLRSDIYWASRRWREASEQIELLYGERWKNFQPLTELEKSDIIRATIGYALAEDAIGLARFREKYGPKMNDTEADRSAFAIAGKPASAGSADFAKIAKMAATIDTLDGFLRDMRARFPDAMARAKLSPELKADPEPTGALPAIVGHRKMSAAR